MWDDLPDNVYGFGEDAKGELYVLLGSSVRRFESVSDCVLPEVFADDFESGDASARVFRQGQDALGGF